MYVVNVAQRPVGMFRCGQWWRKRRQQWFKLRRDFRWRCTPLPERREPSQILAFRGMMEDVKSYQTLKTSW